MSLADKIAKYVPTLPPALRQMLDAELAAGNEINDVEIGRGPDEGKIAVVVNHPFRAKPAAPPPGDPGVTYRETGNRHIFIFGFHTADDRFALITGKFKPMVLQPLPPGPPNPTEAHITAMNKRAQDEEAARAARIEAARLPPPPPTRPDLAAAGNKFLASMVVTFDMWHDGLGYDLETLAQLSPAELKIIESILIHHQPRDWRDIEALARIDSPAARQAVAAAVHSTDPHVRREAMHHAPEKIDPAKREELLIHSLENDGLYTGLSQAIDEVPAFHPPAVIDALFRGALNRDGQAAIHFAALLYFLHGKAQEPFDWNHRAFFLRFDTPSRSERIAIFHELCSNLGVDPAKYVR